MDLRIGGLGQLSPLEESSAEVSRDSGVVSQSESSLSMVSEGLSSGTVSQSQSFSVPISQPEQEDECESVQQLQQTTHSYGTYIRASAAEEIQNLEKSLEEMLTRVDEFVGMLDMIRNDTSQVVNENLPQIHKKSEEMREIYRKIDKLEAFVKMVGIKVSVMEDQVAEAEGGQGTLPGAFKKIFRTINVPGFLNKPTSPRRPQLPPQDPFVFRTEDYFTSHADH
ncbi:hypothetical protein GJAV_G00100110 [Gymnothorax javanicus]|nr:hypothetical protein GJAV_G00100110 [Gymnothorax javanicus]